MADAFAELMRGEKAVLAEMGARVRARASPDDLLRKLGLAGGDRSTMTAIPSTAMPRSEKPKPRLAVADDRSLDAIVASASSKTMAAAPALSPRAVAARPVEATSGVPKPAATPAPAARGGLESVLALRKTQVGKATVSGQLSSLRSGKDSDDDDDEDDAEPAAPSGAADALSHGDAASFDRALNMLGDASVTTRHAALKQLCGLRLGGAQRKALLRPLLLRFADPAERCRDCATGLFESWVEAADGTDVSGCLPFLVPVLVERIGTQATAEPSEEIRAKLVAITTNTLFKVCFSRDRWHGTHSHCPSLRL